MARIFDGPISVDCENSSITEVIQKLNDGRLRADTAVVLTQKSARKIAKWLEELDTCRNAIDDMRVIIGKVPVR